MLPLGVSSKPKSGRPDFGFDDGDGVVLEADGAGKGVKVASVEVQ